MTVEPPRIGPYRVFGPYPGGGLRAFHIEHHERVHLDVRELCDDWRTRAVQLLRATTLAAALDHPGVARIRGRGVLPDRRPWLATELADGVILSDLLARRTLAVDEALALVRDLTSIAAHVHGHGLVHGAIHPHAIVMRTGERAFSIQLGAWSELRAAGAELDGEIALTPYAAPEPRADGRADVFAIGVLAYRALIGRLPRTTPELVAGVPGVVGSLIVGMLAPDPADRPDAATVHATTVELTGDRTLAGPRFARPRWTPAPEDDAPPAAPRAAPPARRGRT